MKNIIDFKRFSQMGVILSTLAMSNLVFANPNDTHRQVEQLASEYVLSQLHRSADEYTQASTQPIDKRIHIPVCDSPFIPYASHQSLQQSNVTVKVSCESSDWYLYVMVKVQQTQPVVVATSALSPGSIIGKNDITLVNMDKNQLRKSTFADIDDVIGARSKRRLRSGQPVSPDSLCFVCKGDAVTIHANIGGIEVKTTGMALEDGVIGEQILVQNSRSERTLNAKVTSHADVAVNL